MCQKKELIWKEINDTNGFYEVNNIGEIRSVNRTIFKKNGRTERRVGSTIKPILDSFGYLCVMICLSGNYKNKKIHRLVAEAFIEKIPGKNLINHKDGDKKNNKVENLEWVTAKENTSHAIKIGLFATGLKHKKSIQVVNNNTGDIYISIKEASIKMGINYSTLRCDIYRKVFNYISIPREGTGYYSINMPDWPQTK